MQRAWKEAGLKDTDQKPQSNDNSCVLDASKANRQSSPCKQQDAEPHRGSDVVLHDPIAWDLEHCIRNREQGDSQGVAMRCQAGDLEHIVVRLGVKHASIANISYTQSDQSEIDMRML